MASPPTCLGRLVVGACLFCPSLVFAESKSGETRYRSSTEATPFRTRTTTSSFAAQLVPVHALPAPLNEKVRRTLTQPTLVTRASAQEFRAAPAMYEWLVEHPDRAAIAWRRLGVQCSPIQDRGQGRFGWRDDIGSDVQWWVIARSAQARVWYAEGHVKAGPLLPAVPVRSVVVLRHELPASDEGVIRHEIDIFCHADSRAANLAYRLFGSSADRLAEQAAEQMLTFFSALAQYFNEHPEEANRLLLPTTAVRGASR